MRMKKLKEFKRMNKESTKDNSKKENEMEKENSIGIMVNIMRENGKMVRSMEVGIGDLKKVKAIWENGQMGK